MSANDAMVTACWVALKDHGQRVDPDAFRACLSAAGYAMHNAARDWSLRKYGQGIGKEASDGCYRAMLAASEPTR